MKKRSLIICSILLSAVLLLNAAGCGTSAQQKPVAAGKTTDLMTAVNAAPVDGLKTDDAFRNAYLSFAASLLKESYAGSSDSRSVLLSPLSVMTALAMTLNGAEGETRTELEEVLTRGESGSGAAFGREELNRYLYRYYKELPSSERSRFFFANSVWFKEQDSGFRVEEEFLRINKACYGAEAFQAPFNEETRNDINGWIDRKTDHMIPKMLDEISDADVMFLINALLFDAEWENPFGSNTILPQPFHAINGAQQSVPMMFSDESLLLLDSGTVGIMKPYAGDKYRFAAFMPLDEAVDFSQYVNGLDAAGIESLLNSVTRKSITLTMPKFSVEYGEDLVGTLRRVGITHAFGDADFSGISKGDALSIGHVLHRTRLDLDNAGTKAAAVTVVTMTRAAMPMPGEITAVRLDRPFVYMIIDTAQMLPIFIGTVTAVP